MHYRNGRTAKAGDLVVNLETGESGIIRDLDASTDTCNARLTRTRSDDPYVTLGKCLALDDIRFADVWNRERGPAPDTYSR